MLLVVYKCTVNTKYEPLLNQGSYSIQLSTLLNAILLYIRCVIITFRSDMVNPDL